MRNADTKIKTADELIIRRWKKQESTGYRVFRVINLIIMIVISVATLFPFLYLVAQSFSSEAAIIEGKVIIFPVGFNITTYLSVLRKGDFLLYYRNTLFYTVIGTTCSLLLSALLAYPLSKPHLKGNKFIAPFVIFTMYFGGGMIPTYVLIAQGLDLWHKWPAFIIPALISTYYVLLMRAFFIGSPHELEEAGELDGLSQFGVFFRIVLPLSKPIMATMTLFYAVSYWNNWWNAFLYLDKPQWPVAYYIRTIISYATTSNDPGDVSAEKMQVAANIKSTSMVLMALPIICAYPLVQRYYVQGMMLGGVKE
ncbi:MAG: carbohydrate ABC transporter permease [Clostridiales bacterium]|nr:carbohydrate ABC transporter permease [Clostridiales bacterium]